MSLIKTARVVAVIVFCGSALSAAAHSAAGTPRGLMPKILTGVSLGMTETDFRKVRPTAERFVIFGEPKEDDPNPWYTEPVKGDPYFDLATFAFTGHRLCAVSLSALGQGEVFRLKQAKVLQGAVRKWGAKYERLWKVVAESGPKPSPARIPALLWKLGNHRVLATFSDGGAPASKGGGLSISILDTLCLPPDLQRKVFSTLVPAKGGSSAFKILETPVEPPLFE